jgi:hypothetical protein
MNGAVVFHLDLMMQEKNLKPMKNSTWNTVHYKFGGKNE